jgi:formylglycine-generating enzyme
MGLMDVSLWDNYKHALEAQSGGRNTVIFDDQNLPSIMVRTPAFSVEDIDADLGTGSHPAFLVNAVQKTHFMVGMYQSYVYGTRAYSLPYKDPACSLDFDASLNDCLRKNEGDTTRRAGWHMMTNWEAAALALLCIKNGQPSGNTDYGRHYTNKQQTGIRQDSLLPGTTSGTARTLTGSGPAEWRHDGTMQGVSDLVGNTWEWVDGMKLNVGKFYLPTDNYYTLAEASWPTDNVILALDTSLKLGVSGTDTLHTNGGPTTWRSGLGRTAAYTALSDAIKQRHMQAMIDPYFDTVNPVGILYWDCSGERMPFRFGAWGHAAAAGVAALILNDGRSGTNTSIGFRLAYIG